MTYKSSIFLLLLLIPFLCISQWSLLGNDITGMEGDKIGSNHSISIDGAGQVIAIGSAFNGDNGSFSGYAKVFQIVSDEWVLKGEVFEGTLPDTEGTGASVSLSEDGNTVAIGSSHGINSLGYRCGVVNVYDWDGTSWILKGEQIDGEGNINPIFATDGFGSAVSLSADGNSIIIGARGNTPEIGVLQISGHARIFNWDGTKWVQKGKDIDGLTGLEEFGYSVSISDNGNIVAIGARSNNEVAQSAGCVRTYQWNGFEWEQRGETIFGNVIGENFGNSVSLSSDGNSLGFGGPNKASTTVPGSARVFDWNDGEWNLRGEAILGENSSQTGTSIDLSSDGNIIAVGEPWHNGAYGQVRLFRWTDNTWEQIDNAIDESGPANSINVFGSSVSLSKDGSTVAIGAFGFDTGSFTDEGQVKIFNNQSIVNIDDLQTLEISCYPNPTSEKLTIASEEYFESLELFSVTGNKLQSIIVNNNSYNFDISQIPAGSYFMKVKYPNKTITLKVTKI